MKPGQRVPPAPPALLARAGGKRELLPELLELARASIEKALSGLTAAAEAGGAGDPARIAALAHRLRGTLETLGATPAALAAAALELRARAHPPRWGVALADLQREVRRLLAALEQWEPGG